MKKVYAYIHTHWDREWYREFEEFRVRLIEVIDDVLEKLKRNELETFYFDGQTSALEDYLEIRPENEPKIKDLIAQKRFFIGPYYCSTDSFLVDSESIIKNLQMGISQSKDFGCHDYIGYHADTFGHSALIPEIVKYFKIPNAVFWRGLGELESEFLFNGLKSTYLIEGYFHDYFSSNLSYEKKAEFLKRTLDRISKYSSDSILLPIGADHLAVCDSIKDQIKEVSKYLEDYEIILSTPFEYFEKVQNNYNRNIIGEFRDTKRNFILPGVYSSRVDIKQENSCLQWKLARVIQPIQSILNYLKLSKSYQSEVDYAYKLLIKNHAHDSIYGCCVDDVHKESQMRFKKVEQCGNALLNNIKRDVLSDGTISIVNLSNFDFNGAVKIKTDKKLAKKYNAQLTSKTKGFPLSKVYTISQIPITEDYTDIYEYLIDVKNLKPFSITRISDSNLNTKSDLKITENSIENEKIGLIVQNGKIVLTDKKKNKKYVDFIRFIDRADIGDSYNFGALKNDLPIASKIIRTKILEKGKIRSIFEIDFELSIPSKSSSNGRSKSTKKHILKMQAILENQNEYIGFKTAWENKSKDHVLQVEFNMEKPVTETVSDDLSGYIKRDFDPDYDIYEHIPAPRGTELKNNVAPFQKSLFVQGVGFVTKGLQEYEVFKNNLRITLLRSTGTISNPVNPTRGTPAGPPLPTPELQMLGQNKAEFALAFKDNISNLEPIAEKFYGTTIAMEAKLENVELFDSGNKNILVNTIKLNKENDLIIRFVNKSDTKESLAFTTNLENKGIFITDAMENITEQYKSAEIQPNSFITLLIKKSE